MKAILRASVIAAALLTAWAALAPSRAEPCRIGPAAFEAPACTVVETDEGTGPARYVQWQEGGKVYTVFVVTTKKPTSLRGYLARWRRRACTTEEIPFHHELSFEGAARDGKRRVPPRITWAGKCVSPEWFMNHAIGLQRQVVELRVTHLLGSGDSVPLEAALAALLDRVRIYPVD